MTPLTIALSLAAIAILFIAAPFLRGRGQANRDLQDAMRAGRGAGPVESALPDPLEELEIDRAMGKVSDEDYVRIRGAILEQRELVAAPAHPATHAEEPRSIDDPAIVEGAESMIRAARSQVARCETCGVRPEPAARFCSNCGRAIVA